MHIMKLSDYSNRFASDKRRERKGLDMGFYTQKEKEMLSEDPQIRKRLLDFASMSGKEFFREVQSRLSPKELEEYLEENPEEQIYLMTPPHK